MDDIYKKVISNLKATPFKAAELKEVYSFLLNTYKLDEPVPLKKKGKYITVDGIGGSGKDTLIDDFKKTNKYIPFREDEHDPFRSVLKKYWRKTPTKKYNPNIPAYLIACGKMYVNCSNLSQSLVNSNVIANRSFLSTVALSAAEGVSLKEMIKAYYFFPVVPDQRILLSCDPIVAYQRKVKDNSVGRSDSLDFLSKSYLTFLELKRHFPVLCIDTTHLTAQEVVQRVNQTMVTSG